MRSAKEMQEKISEIYLRSRFAMAEINIEKELIKWEKNIRDEFQQEYIEATIKKNIHQRDKYTPLTDIEIGINRGLKMAIKAIENIEKAKEKKQ